MTSLGEMQNVVQFHCFARIFVRPQVRDDNFLHFIS